MNFKSAKRRRSNESVPCRSRYLFHVCRSNSTTYKKEIRPFFPLKERASVHLYITHVVVSSCIYIYIYSIVILVPRDKEDACRNGRFTMVVPFIRFPNTIFIRGDPYDGESRFWRCKALQRRKTRGDGGGCRWNAMKKEKLSGVGEPIVERHPGNTREAL